MKKPMTVKSLIDKLYKYPLDAEVSINFDYGNEEECKDCEGDCIVVCTLEVNGRKKPVMKASCGM